MYQVLTVHPLERRLGVEQDVELKDQLGGRLQTALDETKAGVVHVQLAHALQERLSLHFITALAAAPAAIVHVLHRAEQTTAVGVQNEQGENNGA